MNNLFPHNEQAYAKVMHHFSTGHNRAAVVHATGTGKSYIGGAVAANYNKVLIVAPNEYVLDAASAVAQHAECRTYSWIAQQDVVPTGYDLIWFDEFHRMGAETWSVGCARLIDANPQAKIFGSTATDERYLEGRNMADEWFQGDVVSRLSLSDAWIQHVLRVPKYIIGVVSMDDTKADYSARIRSAKRLNAAQKSKAQAMLDQVILNWANSYGVPHILEKYIDKDVERIVVFAQTIEKLREMSRVLPQWFKEADIDVAGLYVVHSGMGRSEALQGMRDFENDNRKGIKIMLSVDMLNEGVHVDRVDAVIMFRATISKNIYMQQIGRCFAVGQRHQPIIIDLADNLSKACGYEGIYIARERFYENGIPESEFSNQFHDAFDVIDTLKSTRDILEMLDRQCADHRSWEDIAQYIDAFWKEHGRLPGRKDDESVYSYLKMHRQQYYIDKYPERIKFLQERGWEIKVKHDEYNYERATSEIRSLLRQQPIISITSTGSKAMRYLRYMLKSGRATEEQTREINSLGITFKNLREAWNQKFAEMKEVYDRTGSLVSLNKSQRSWIYFQCGSAKLDEEQQSLLRSIGAYELEKVRVYSTTDQLVSRLRKYVDSHDGYFPTASEENRLYSYWHGAYVNKSSTWSAILAAGMGEHNIRPKTQSYLDIIEEFFAVHGRLPVEGEPEYNALRKHVRALTTEQRAYMKTKFGYKNPMQLAYEARLTELKVWLQSHGCLPTDSYKRPADERRLAVWVRNQMLGTHKGEIESLIQGYKHRDPSPSFKTVEIETRFARLREYVQSTNSLPDEGTELMDDLRALSPNKRIRKEFHELFAPFGHGSSAGWVAVTQKMCAIREYYKTHGHLPNSNSECRDLYNTVSCCKRWLKKGMYKEYCQELITMGYEPDLDRTAASYEVFRQRLIDYLQANDGLLPASNEAKPFHDFSNFKRLHPEAYDALIREYGTGQRRNPHTTRTLAILSDYLTTHGHIPTIAEDRKMHYRFKNFRQDHRDLYDELLLKFPLV